MVMGPFRGNIFLVLRGGGGARLLVLRQVNDHGLSGGEEGGNTRGVNKSSTDNLGGVDDTLLDHISVLSSSGVEAEVDVLAGEDLLHNNRALGTSVLRNRGCRRLEGLADDVNTDLLVEVGRLELIKTREGAEESSATAGDDALLNSSAGGVECISHTVTLLADLDFRGTANLEDGDTTGKLSKTFLQLLLLPLTSGLSDLLADGLRTRINVLLVTTTVQKESVVLGDNNLANRAQLLSGNIFELGLKSLLAQNLGTGEDGHIMECVLAVVAKARGLDGDDLDLTAELVHNDSGKSLAIDILSDNNERLALADGDLKGGDDLLSSGDLLLREKDKGILELSLVALGGGDEEGGDVATVELHTLGNLKLVIKGLAILNGDDTVLANSLHGVGNEVTDLGVAVGGNGGDLGDLLRSGHRARELLKTLDDDINSGLNTTAEIKGVKASGNSLETLLGNSAGKDGGSGGTITSNVIGLGGNILNKTSTDVLILVLKLDSLGHSHTILGDLRTTI
eukprot:Colp12_sorted_trinity150504_noHs@26170